MRAAWLMTDDIRQTPTRCTVGGRWFVVGTLDIGRVRVQGSKHAVLSSPIDMRNRTQDVAQSEQFLTDQACGMSGEVVSSFETC